MTKTNFTVGALGDSISVAFNAVNAGDNAEHSWATGDSDSSHLQRLRRRFTELDVRAVNTAFNGARAADLRGQVDRLVQSEPDYVTMMIGANDLVRWLTGEYGVMLDQYVDDVRGAIKRLVDVNPRVMIVLSAVPDQSQVLDLIGNRQGALERAAAYLNTVAGAAFAKLMVGIYKERSVRLNRALADVAQRHSGNVRFCGGIATARFSGEHLSPIDSYHPSVQGQQLLAKLTWNEGFFP
jgi:lysophospholipase L1-like esterase